ncbi:MAG TPA: BlaI/MecI/CopY family transcriptional regulator [Candidatus Gemmiger excrementigallinarum]|uniref:BlaI/MecI/CopY family transcriptional regulator n=1 Tax=Candidatus Gemmiger excrementigallinarum TaxID=2838609 RepID=A0A9D2ER04_9FIRM|nr:BlaI/MecI/CopY family transcriptional regulator [Candidatus Gemmiger excrementigallinarum]
MNGMEALSRSEEQVMVALWACGRAATRREIAAKLPAECHWADTTLLNFLLRLEKKSFVRTEKQGNKNLYTPLVRRLTYCGAVSEAHLQTLYGGDLRGFVRALADTDRIGYADIERLLRWLGEYQAANPEYDYE